MTLFLSVITVRVSSYFKYLTNIKFYKFWCTFYIIFVCHVWGTVWFLSCNFIVQSTIIHCVWYSTERCVSSYSIWCVLYLYSVLLLQFFCCLLCFACFFSFKRKNHFFFCCCCTTGNSKISGGLPPLGKYARLLACLVICV